MPDVNPRRLTSNMEKLQYHAHRAERTQAQIEEMERQAKQAGAAQQAGRMERRDGSAIPDSYMGKTLLKDNPNYQRLVGIRNSHQAQVSMYSSLIGAGSAQTGNPRVACDDGSYRFED